MSTQTQPTMFLIEVHLRENDATVPPYAVFVIWKYEDNRRYGLYSVGNSRTVSSVRRSYKYYCMRDTDSMRSPVGIIMYQQYL